MLTSLAPSPMASVTCPAPSRTSRVTCAFCSGDTRQHTTACRRSQAIADAEAQ